MPSEAAITVSEFRPLKKGDSLQGFVTLELESGMVLHDCAYHRRDDGTRWVGLPARPYTTSDGEKGWTRVVDFIDKQTTSGSRRVPWQPLIATLQPSPPNPRASPRQTWIGRSEGNGEHKQRQ